MPSPFSIVQVRGMIHGAAGHQCKQSQSSPCRQRRPTKDSSPAYQFTFADDVQVGGRSGQPQDLSMSTTLPGGPPRLPTGTAHRIFFPKIVHQTTTLMGRRHQWSNQNRNAKNQKQFIGLTNLPSIIQLLQVSFHNLSMRYPNMTQEYKFVYDNDAYFPATQNEYMIIHWTTGHIFLAPFSKIKQIACVYSLFFFISTCKINPTLQNYNHLPHDSGIKS